MVLFTCNVKKIEGAFTITDVDNTCKQALIQSVTVRIKMYRWLCSLTLAPLAFSFTIRSLISESLSLLSLLFCSRMVRLLRALYKGSSSAGFCNNEIYLMNGNNISNFSHINFQLYNSGLYVNVTSISSCVKPRFSSSRVLPAPWVPDAFGPLDDILTFVVRVYLPVLYFIWSANGYLSIESAEFCSLLEIKNLQIAWRKKEVDKVNKLTCIDSKIWLSLAARLQKHTILKCPTDIKKSFSSH